MKNLFLILNCLLCTYSFSQNWLHKIGSIYNEEILDITHDSNGDLILGGYHSQNLTISGNTLIAGGYSQGLLVKTNANGNVLWSKNLGGNGADRINSVVTDNNGNIYSTGYVCNSFDQEGQPVSTNSNSRDILISKHDASGNLIWIKTAGGPGGDTGYGIALDSDANVFVTGQFKQNAVFGSDNLTGSFDIENNIETYDFFISKLDTDGNFLWTKKGDAPLNDRGMSVAVDENNDVYIGGQFSDTLTYDNVQNNNIINAGFLLKVDNNGNELWFSKMAGLQSILYDVKIDPDNNPIITGDFKGNMIVFGIGNQIITNSAFDYNTMVAKYSPDGAINWISHEGSDNEVSSKQITIDQHGNIYSAGVFKCRFTELSQEHGNGIFYSSGYRDVFSLCYNNQGTRLWKEHYGGSKDDYCSAISINSFGLAPPSIAGSFERYFNTPGSNLSNNPNEYELYQGASFYCSESLYQNYAILDSVGGKDIFLGQLYHENNGMTDYFQRISGGSCVQDTVQPCISNCLDSLEFCDNGMLSLTSFTLNQGKFGPILKTNWQNEGWDYNQSYFINQTGDYSLLVSREDECWVDLPDTVHVIIHETPESPLITDNWSVNIDQPPFTNPVVFCRPDSAIIHVDNFSIPDTAYWTSTDPFELLNDSTIQVVESGFYTIKFESNYGCNSQNQIYVSVDTFAIHDTLQPHIIFLDSMLEITDTIEICQGESVEVSLIDSLFIGITGGTTPFKTVYWDVNNPASITSETNTSHIALITTNITGDYVINAHLENLCGDTVDYFLSRNLHVIVHPMPTITGAISGPTNVCPRDSVVIHYSSSSDDYVFFGPNIITDYGDSALIEVGLTDVNYTISGSVSDSITGCSSGFYETWELGVRPNPVIVMDPAHGIVCPDDSVKLTALSGIAWDWIGPNDNSFADSQITYGFIPGYYHAIVTDFDGCVMTSNFVEAKEYSTPFIFAEPEVICPEGSSEIQVISHLSSIVNWQAPLSGSSFTQVVSDPGTYYCEIEMCDILTVDSVTITVSNPIATIAASDTLICPNDTVPIYANGGMMEYDWNDSNGDYINFVTNTGDYWVIVTNEYGCKDTSNTIHISSLPAPDAPITSDTTICLGGSVELVATASNDILWYQHGAQIHIGDTLVLTEINDISTYSLRTEDSLCSSEWALANINFHQSSLSPSISIDTMLCEGSNLFGSTPETNGFDYEWIYPNGNTSNNSSFLMTDVDSSLHTGWYQLHVSDSICDSDTSSIFVQINTYPDVHLSFSGDTILCAGTTLTLNIENFNPSYSVTWSNTMEDESFIEIEDAGTYYAQIENFNCVSFSDSLIVAYAAPLFTPLVSDTLICPGNSAQLSTEDGTLVQWYNENGGSILLDSTLIINEIFEQLTFDYQLIDSNGCSSELASAHIFIAPTDSIPPIYIDGTGCDGTSVTLSSINYPNLEYSWILPNASIIQSEEILIDPMIFQDAGTYQLSLSLNGCLSDTNQIELEYHIADSIQLPTDTTICSGEILNLEFTSDLNYDWNYGSNLNLLEFSDNGLVTVIITDSNGCQYTDSIQVNLVNCDSLVRPNVFTPNGDQINDRYRFVIIETQSQYVEIKNRYGNPIYTASSDDVIYWDGNDRNGKNVSDGTYFYYFKYTDWNGEEHEFHGFLELIR